VLDALRRSALTAAPLTHGIALRSEALEGFGSEDPADPFLVAAALEHELVLVTADRAMRGFPPVETLW
jgi:PIN domain nuclease of toxin-antitoxin system